MSAPRWREEPIGRQHDRAGFDCGSPALNAYLQGYARQNHESGGAKTFVAAAPGEPTRILELLGSSAECAAKFHSDPAFDG